MVPECYSGLLPWIDFGISNFFDKFGKPEMLAFSWLPLGRLHADLQKLMEQPPLLLKTVYLLDLNTPLRINVREFARLKINAGPWFGHWFAFVDLESNPVDDLAEYLKHKSDEDRQAIIYEINELQQGFDRRRGRPTVTKVRILTPVIISVN
jgi:hypothetical protein